MDMNMIQQLMRLQSIFGGNPSNGVGSQDVISPTIQGNPTVSQPYVSQQQQQGYQPQNTASQAYSSFLNQYPQQQTPSLARKIGGVLAGFGAGVSPAGYEGGQAVGFRGNPAQAMQVSDAFTNAPHYRDVEEWQNRIKPLAAAATEEDRRNVNSRIAYEQEENRKIAQQKADEAERKNREAEEDNDQKIAISQQRADIAAKRADIYKEIAKGGIIKTDQDGKNWMVYKDGTKTDVGIESLSPAELQQLKTESALEEIRAREAATQKDIAARGAQSRATKAAPSSASEWGPAMQVFDNQGKPTGVIQVNKVNGSVREVQVPGNIKNAPASSSAGGTTVVDKTTTGPQPTILGFPVGKPKETTTHTTTVKTPAGAAPKIGDTKKFANGNVGEWDGHGWVLKSGGK